MMGVRGRMPRLFALDKITRATRGFWHNFGKTVSVVIVGAVTLLFVEILVYIGTSLSGLAGRLV